MFIYENFNFLRLKKFNFKVYLALNNFFFKKKKNKKFMTLFAYYLITYKKYLIHNLLSNLNIN